MEGKHTATPEYEVHQGLDYIVVLGPDDTTDSPTAEFYELDVAQKFVRACNAHDDLVKALQAMEMAMLGYVHQNDITKAALAKCRAALAKAGAQTPRFEETFCSQCGDGFGPGDSGFSHCTDHASLSAREA